MNTAAPGRSLFIYWKLAPALAGPALQAAQSWQAALLAANPGLQTGLYRRGDAAAVAEAHITVMETYAAPGGIDAGLQARIEAEGLRGLQRLGAPQRHVEVFEAVDAGAG